MYLIVLILCGLVLFNNGIICSWFTYTPTKNSNDWIRDLSITLPITYTNNNYKITTGGEFVYDTRGCSIGFWQKSITYFKFHTYNIAEASPIDMLTVGY